MNITMTDLIESLRRAAANPEAHATAQQSYFSDIQEGSVLVNCGTACCIAGDLILKSHLRDGVPQKEIDQILNFNGEDPGDWVRVNLGLSNVEAVLAFDPDTHHEIHLLLADLLEDGFRLPDLDAVSIGHESTYTEFLWAYLEDEDEFMDLDELKDWMRSIAK